VPQILHQFPPTIERPLFNHFLDTLGLLKVALDRKGAKCICLHGSLPLDERQRRIDLFSEGRVQVALCSLKAIGHGVNLTAANHVIHVDRWWNPAVEDQATDRVHRIGQTRTVFVHRILTADTLEEKIATLLDRKRGLSDQIMTAAAPQRLQWTREELLELLKPLEA
jgi:SNF2 family DNA or RNA helicase